MNPFTFINDTYNHKTLLEERKLEKVEVQLVKSRTARIFNLRCLAYKVTPKTLQIKWKGNNFEQATIRKAKHWLTHNTIKCTNNKINHFQTEMANPKTSLQQKPDDPTFTNLQNTIFNNKEKTFLHYKKGGSSTWSPEPPQQPLRWPPSQKHLKHCHHLFYYLRYPG